MVDRKIQLAQLTFTQLILLPPALHLSLFESRVKAPSLSINSKGLASIVVLLLPLSLLLLLFYCFLCPCFYCCSIASMVPSLLTRGPILCQWDLSCETGIGSSLSLFGTFS